MRRHDRRGVFVRCGLAVILVLAVAGPGRAQWAYPYRYGGYGWSRWGADPGAGYMAGLGSFARGQGDYAVQKARADAIERDSLIKWNRALMARRRALAAEQAARQAQEGAAARAEIAADALADGTTLNNLLERILETDPAATRAAAARTPVTPELIRAIPFETASEPITLCLDQLTQGESWPPPLSDPEFADGRRAVGQAVDRALREDAQGAVTDAAVRALQQAVARLHDRYVKETSDTEPGYYDGDQFLRTLAGLAGMLRNPNVKQVLDELETYRGGTIGDLIAFMHSFNLRFAPAQDARQRTIYAMLADAFRTILTADLNEPADGPPPEPAASAAALQSAARDAFRGMSWDDLRSAAADSPGAAPPSPASGPSR